jgi:hypothetical protein
MKKIYSLVFVLLPFSSLYSQCPVINGAFVNSCGTEGLNEFVVFTTTAQSAASNYVLYYGSGTPPSINPTGILSGATARTQNGTGTITTGLCNVTYVTSGATVIPAGVQVVFIPSNFDNNFNISPLCTGGTIWIVLIDITLAPNIWNSAGTLEDSPASARYIQVKNGASDCLLFTRSYTNGWAGTGDGNIVFWDAITGTPTFANGGCDLVTVPVTLVSFTAVAQGKNASITWQSASEINTKSFELQRSSDGNNFTTIYTSTAAGQSSTIKKYSFNDMDIPSGSSYYRLKMTDIDGGFTYSKIAKVISTRNGFVITNLYPKPANSQLSISWNAPRSGITTANVFDFSGRKLITQQMATSPGMNYFHLQVASLPKGAYLLKLEKEGETIISEFTRQ